MAVPKGAVRELKRVDVNHVSLVGLAANKRKFKVLKSAEGQQVEVYKTAGWVPPVTKEEKPRTILDKFLGMFEVLKKSTTHSAPDEVGAVADNLVAVLKSVGSEQEDDPMSGTLTLEQVQKENADLRTTLEVLTKRGLPGVKVGTGRHAATIGMTNFGKDATEGLEDDAPILDVIDRLKAVLDNVHAAANATPKADETDKNRNRRKELKGMLDTLGTSMIEMLKGLPEDLRTISDEDTFKAFGKRPKPGAPGGPAGAPPLPPFKEEEEDASAAGAAAEAANPDKTADLEKRLDDLLKSVAVLTAQNKDLADEITELKDAPGGSKQGADGGSPSGGGTSTKKASPWHGDMASKGSQEAIAKADEIDSQFDDV